jgi:hypothetical protein
MRVGSTEIMQLAIIPPKPSATKTGVSSNDFYQKIKNSSNTIVSLQYNNDKFLSFKVYEAQSGTLVRQGDKDIALRCQIRGSVYTFTREHVTQMSKREFNDLLSHLGIDSSQLN